MKKAARALVLLASSTLVVCGVKGSPRPPQAAQESVDGGADAGRADGGSG